MGLKPSAKMKKAVKVIEETLHIKCKDKSFEGVQKFIQDNLEKSKEIDIRSVRPPSDKMLKAIAKCEEVLGVRFEGKSMLDASNYLSENLPKLKERNYDGG